ncbi:NAD(P)/FAD-dependent oxidoreductase [Ahrensia sp. R2A130]|uniref:NAD(P)/FAD-dependent oxidoreductase n=1 Tax=Ahrensia sp. R2A130 TaxID=744979 RepID=UPI0001E09443|nr:NAD(P)/FAD-dependent oxidoreductase [Ahrensia sp. R2A130]EFL89574.1 FAD-dependent oxidoreductase [Ahrensia sp. R2A130]
MHDIETIVIGAGAVGLAVARSLAMSGREVMLLERHAHYGQETSARNSEVIHAGIYYPQGSLKAQLCVRGRDMLYDFAAANGVETKQLGKLVVANGPQEDARLDEIAAHANACGVTNLRRVVPDEIADMEPDLQADTALLSPSTGIMDSHGLMTVLLGEAEEHGAMLVTRSAVERIERLNDGFAIHTGPNDPARITAKEVVCSMGLDGDTVFNRSFEGRDDWRKKLRYAKGNYYRLSGRAPFSRLIYPVPQPGGLGVHLTLDLAGQARFGPDVEWVDDLAYEVDPARADVFYEAIRRYWPALPDGALEPDYSGIRPKLSGPGEPNADFEVWGEERHSMAGFTVLAGIESPGLTSCLAIGEYVAERMASAK